MLRAVPAMVRTAASRSAAVRSGVFVFATLPGGVVVMNDDFGYLRSVVATLQHGRPWTDEWLEPWSAGLSVLSALVYLATGSWLLAIQGVQALLARLNVILAAPDIDVDVFQRQMAVIGTLRRPLTVLVSPDDKALSLSGTIAGSRPRVGALNVRDPKVAELALKSQIQIVDISTLKASDGFNHDRFVNVAALYPRLVASATRRSTFSRASALMSGPMFTPCSVPTPTFWALTALLNFSTKASYTPDCT